MRDRFEYWDYFVVERVKRVGTLLVVGDGKMDSFYCQNYTINLEDAFFNEFQKFCTGQSMAMNFSYELDAGMKDLIRNS